MNQGKVGKFIAKLRKEKNMTQEQLAEKMGVSINAVSKWERGLSFPDISLYKSLCEELEISIEELINGERDNSEEAKDRAILSTIKEKNKTKKKLNFVFLVSVIVIIILIILVSFIYRNGEDELEKYYERNYQMTFVARDVEAFLRYRYDGKYPDYYGGMYISDDARNLVVQIVKDKISQAGTMDFYYYNELFTIDDSIKVEYVKNSYNELEEVFNKINDYLTSNQPPKNFNSVGIDIYKNSIVVNYVEINEEVKKEFKEKIIDSDLVIFEAGIKNINLGNKCLNYPEDVGSDVLMNSGNLLISINIGNKNYIPVSLNVYDNGTYELFTSYKDCEPGRICISMLIYTKSVKGTYSYDIEKILNSSTNANDKTYDMNDLPEYEIYLGEKYMKQYNSLMLTVEKGKKNKYLDEFLESINVDLSKCAKPEY